MSCTLRAYEGIQQYTSIILEHCTAICMIGLGSITVVPIYSVYSMYYVCMYDMI